MENKNKGKLVGTSIRPTPMPKQEIGIDTTNSLEMNILNAAVNSILDISKLEGFSAVAQTRENIYKILDSMGQDSIISSILETYAEDTVETNEQGRIMWAESSDADALKYVMYLLDSMNVDKHLYGWAYSLIKYGDLYLRLYKESDRDDDDIFAPTERQRVLTEALETLTIDDEYKAISEMLQEEKKRDEKKSADALKEDVNIITHRANDNYIHYIEAVSNPGEMFELTRFGKTMGYVEAPVKIQGIKQDAFSQYLPAQYKMRRGDVNIYSAMDFVHASLEDTSARQPEEVEIFLDDKSDKGISYKVRRGQSLLYNNFKIWRELSLLENSVLLNRVTKSSIIRMISVEVGDMPKEQIGPHLAKIKSLVEQKSAIDTGNSMQEYTNPGPVENNIYIPTHGGIGAISSQQIGGDVDPKQLTDLSYYQDKFFGGFRVPKQFFGVTDDATGFNGGTSLSIISSRYGKAIKRIQNTLIQALTDVVNLMLIDKGLTSYLNKFTLRMSAPVTQEEIDKRENIVSKVRIVTDVMNTLNDLDNPIIKLKILKTLLASSLSDTEIISLIQEQIDILESELEEGETTSETMPLLHGDLMNLSQITFKY